MTLRPIAGLRLRRALFGILLSAGRPLTVHEVVADMLGNQVALPALA